MGLQRITMEIPKSPADADSWMLFTREFLHIGTAEAGLASSRLVCRLRSQDGRTSFFEELFDIVRPKIPRQNETIYFILSKVKDEIISGTRGTI